MNFGLIPTNKTVRNREVSSVIEVCVRRGSTVDLRRPTLGP